MAIIEVEILGNRHQLVCDQGEEEKFLQIAIELNKELLKLSSTLPKVTDVKLLILYNMMEKEKNLELQKQISSDKSSTDHISNEEVISKTLDTITEYVENLAKKVEMM